MCYYTHKQSRISTHKHNTFGILLYVHEKFHVATLFDIGLNTEFGFPAIILFFQLW